MDTLTQIKKDKQILKFSFYGFFKNLQFFEPYLLIYLMGMGLNLFQIGLLYSLRGAVIYIFEVPSGMLADQYGKKKELLLCFVFYMISFVFFFISRSMFIVTIGMIFYGLGEAFRSGTHKAMILSYLNRKGWYEYKGMVYGRTRSYSLLGSSLSAFLSILLVLNLPALRWIFLICIIPYMIDFVLVASYPAFLDEHMNSETTLKSFFLEGFNQLKSIGKNIKLIKTLTSSSIYEGVFDIVKDYIQPIMSGLLTAVGVGALWKLEVDQNIKIVLGLLYGVFYIFSSMASKNIYKLCNRYKSIRVFQSFFDILGLLFIGLSGSIAAGLVPVTILIYFIMYVMRDSRRTVFVDVCSDYMHKDQRATVLSIENQLYSLIVIVFAPLFGWIADTFSISGLFIGIGILLIVINRFIKIGPDLSTEGNL